MIFPEDKETQSIIIQGLSNDVTKMKFPHLTVFAKKLEVVGLKVMTAEEYEAIKKSLNVVDQLKTKFEKRSN